MHSTITCIHTLRWHRGHAPAEAVGRECRRAVLEAVAFNAHRRGNAHAVRGDAGRVRAVVLPQSALQEIEAPDRVDLLQGQGRELPQY